jgi:membrane fusion protein (multidrug efflux system)
VRVQVPVGPPVTAVAVPISAVRKGPTGDHVFVIDGGDDGRASTSAACRARRRRAMRSSSTEGLEAGDRVAAAGAFKLYEGARVAIVEQAASDAARSGG